MEVIEPLSLSVTKGAKILGVTRQTAFEITEARDREADIRIKRYVPAHGGKHRPRPRR